MKAILPSAILTQDVRCLAHIAAAKESYNNYAMYTTGGETTKVVNSDLDVYLHFGDTIWVTVRAASFDGGDETDGVFLNGVQVAKWSNTTTGNNYGTVEYTYVVAAYEVRVTFSRTHYTESSETDYYACYIVES